MVLRLEVSYDDLARACDLLVGPGHRFLAGLEILLGDAELEDSFSLLELRGLAHGAAEGELHSRGEAVSARARGNRVHAENMIGILEHAEEIALLAQSRLEQLVRGEAGALDAVVAQLEVDLGAELQLEVPVQLP